MLGGTNMASKTRPSRTKRAASGADLDHLMRLDALRTWVVPTVAAVLGFVTFILYGVEVLPQPAALTLLGLIALAVLLFFGLRHYIGAPITGREAALVALFIALFGVAAAYPYYRTINPGTPVFAGELRRGSPPVTVPLRGEAGRYGLFVDGHFIPVEGKVSRTATYRIAVGHDGQTDRVVDGEFRQEWGTQRVGAGRRSSLVPVLHQTTHVLTTLEDPDGRDLTLSLVELSPVVGDSVGVRLYAGGLSNLLLIILSIAAVGTAITLDLLAVGTSDGLLTTLTIATLIGVAVFRASVSAVPGIPQLIVAAIGGTVGGAITGPLAWRLGRRVRTAVSSA
jgi:hypothetical protein